jgi:uncharacterized protein YlxW (UPF0749 family)
MSRTEPRQRGLHSDLLDYLSDTALDPDYARVSAQRSRPVSKAKVAAVATVLLGAFGLLVALAILQSRDAEPVEEAERLELIDQIGEARADFDVATTELEELRDEIATLQGSAADIDLEGQGLIEQVQQGRLLTGSGAVTGAGMRITIDDAQQGVVGGTVLDEDLQVLVNGLWQAGAEAIAINGNRLGPLSAIRTAGQAINVNFRPLTPPYVVTVIGDPDTLQARFSETAAGQSWVDLSTNYGIRFDIESATDLVLPGVPSGRLRLNHAVREEGS